MPRTCSSCHRVQSQGARSCPYCGALLDLTEAVTASMASTQAEMLVHLNAANLPHFPIELQDERFVPGTILSGRYRIVGLLGRGGMGEVYRADDLKLGQAVAMKFLANTLPQTAAILTRFSQEVRLARQITHPNVCRVFDINEADGRPFIAMEYIDGEDLSSLLRRIGRLPPDKALEVARQLFAGLAAIHEQGAVHCDLKPANVMLDGRGRVRITDFGLADLTGKDGHGAGTSAYMAPEQLAMQRITPKSDIYSLGLVLYELFTGQQAFTAASFIEQ